MGRRAARQGVDARHGARQSAGRARAGAATRQPGASDTAGPGHDTAGPRATTRPVCAPRCAQLGLVGCFVHSDSVYDPV